MSQSILDVNSLQFDTGGNPVTLTSSLNNIDLEGSASADVSLSGIDTINISGTVNLIETGAGTDTISIQAPSSVTTNYTITMPEIQGSLDQILVNDGTGVLTWTTITGNIISYNYTEVNTPTYSALSTDEILAIDYTTTGTCTVTLPEISVVGKKRYFIIDTGGNANTNNITIQTSGSDQIIGDTEIIISENFNAVSILNDDTTDWYIF